MGEALLGGVLNAGVVTAGNVTVVEPVEVRRGELEMKFPGITVAANLDAVLAGSGVVIAVKPVQVVDVCRALQARQPNRVLSIAAGVRLATLEAALGADVAVVRAMPNTPALVGQGASAIAAGSSAGPADTEWAETLLRAVGTVSVVPEAALDAVTGLSGSGPAYVFLIIESLIEGGVAAGLARDVAATLAVQTVLGSAQLAATTGTPPAVLRADVTSPGGTTAAGLAVLERGALRGTIIDAVLAATARSRELGA